MDDAHRGEGLVDLPQVDVVDADAGPVERLGDGDGRAPGRCARGPRPPTPTPARWRAARARGLGQAASATTRAAAPSLIPAALPAVMLNPSISGCSGLSDGQLLHARGPAGVLVDGERALVPSRPVTSIGKISSAKLPASMAATARWCERSAQASISSRVTPASTAAFQPTVIDMSRFGGGRPVAVAGRHPVLPVVGAGHPPGRPGQVDSDCAPPATTTRSMPARIDAAAVVTAARPDAQWRLWATPARARARPRRRRSGRCRRRRRATRPARRRRRAAGSSPDAAHGLGRRPGCPASKASTSTSDPLNAVPIGVRAVETITASAMSEPSFGLDSRREAQGAVEADVLAVQVRVADDRLDEEGELLGAAHPLGEHDALHQLGLDLLGHAQHQRRAHRAGGDGAHPDARAGRGRGPSAASCRGWRPWPRRRRAGRSGPRCRRSTRC